MDQVKVEQAAEYMEWRDSLTSKEQAQVNARIERIELHDHFGDAKHLGDGLAELRWKSGWRVYFTKIQRDDGTVAYLLLGGLKNAQKKDIERARFLLRRYTDVAATKRG